MQFSDRPTLIPIPFAESGGKATIPDTTVDPGRASWTEGFPPETRQPISAGGIPPNGEDMNGVLYDLAGWVRWVGAGGNVAYDSTFATDIGGYPRGAILAAASGGQGMWYNTSNNNSNNPDSGGSGWINQIPLVTPISATSSISVRMQGVIPIDASGGNRTITLPLISGAAGLPVQFDFVRVDSTANTVTLVRAGSNTIEGLTSLPLAVGGRLSLVSNGVDTWYQISALGGAGMQAFTSSGTFTVPAGIHRIFCRVWGAGGGGGGTGGGAASGGCSGGYSEGWYAVSPGASLTVTIGAGGSAGNGSPTGGGAGGTSSVGSLLSATGGAGGGSANGGSVAGVSSPPGDGFGGQVNLSGSPGNAGLLISGVYLGSAGGASFCAPFIGAFSNGPANQAGFPGGGGGGAGGAVPENGAVGANGYALIYW